MFRRLLETIVLTTLLIAAITIPAIADTRSDGATPETNSAGNAVLLEAPPARPGDLGTLYEFGTLYSPGTLAASDRPGPGRLNRRAALDRYSGQKLDRDTRPSFGDRRRNWKERVPWWREVEIERSPVNPMRGR